ncbi:MAG: hypothetical protein GC191_20540 [Azospirillum sp.]|nr:hypothetical protein [Azospirillum sp.]
MRELFARWATPAGYPETEVTPAGNPGNPDEFSRGYQNTPYKNNMVTLVTPVTPKNELPGEMQTAAGWYPGCPDGVPGVEFLRPPARELTDQEVDELCRAWRRDHPNR